MEMCRPVSNVYGNSCLRSSTRGDLAVPRAKTLTYGPRNWGGGGGATTWNPLPQSFHGATPPYTRKNPTHTENVAAPFGLRA